MLKIPDKIKIGGFNVEVKFKENLTGGERAWPSIVRNRL